MTELARRCLFAVAGGGAAALGLIALSAPPSWCAGLGCFFPMLVLVPVVIIGAALVAWGVLAVGRVRQSWLVALVGPLMVLGLVTTVVRWLDLGKAAFVGTAVFAYVVAAVVTSDTVRTAWRVALAAPVVVLFAWGVVAPIAAAAF